VVVDGLADGVAVSFTVQAINDLGASPASAASSFVTPTPVISTVGANADGQPYNVNADEAARAIAVAMKAEKIVYLTAVPGMLDDPKDESTLIPRLTAAELRDRLDHESVGKGMIPKLKACADAVDQGVGFAHIIDGRVHHSLLIELLTDHGVGTMVRKEKSW